MSKKKAKQTKNALLQVRKHNSDALRVLVFDDNFQKDIKELRKLVGVQLNGIKSNLNMQNVRTPAGRAELDYTKEKFDLLMEGWGLPRVNDLLAKYRLTPGCINVLVHYILFNDEKFFELDYFQMPDKNYYVRPIFLKTSNGTESRDEIVITGHLTDNEYRNLKALQDQVFGRRRRRRARKNIDRDLTVVKMTKQKNKGSYQTDKEMAAHIFPDDGEDIESLKQLDENKQAQVIKQARNRLKFK